MFLGEVTLPLDKIDLSNLSNKWYTLGESVSDYVIIITKAMA